MIDIAIKVALWVLAYILCGVVAAAFAYVLTKMEYAESDYTPEDARKADPLVVLIWPIWFVCWFVDSLGLMAGKVFAAPAWLATKLGDGMFWLGSRFKR